MISFLFGLLACFSAFFRSRYNLSLEIIALRQQLGVFKRKNPRPHLQIRDRMFWILLRRIWPSWSNARVIVKPQTVVARHRAGFRLFWRIRSRPKSIGRPKIDAEVRAIIRRMVKENPTWIVQQLRDAFPESCPYRYAILDRDGKFGADAINLLEASGMKPKRTSPSSPWQNGIAERWIGSCRREMLDHMIVLSDAHLRRLIRDYISYYHADRIHDSLNKDSPEKRGVSHKPDQSARLISFPRVGGLHHRYDWQQAA
jgi:transposase InsO family protein